MAAPVDTPSVIISKAALAYLSVRAVMVMWWPRETVVSV
jgi:hypothetical protein